MNRFLLFLLLLLPIDHLEAQVKKTCEAELALRWKDMPFTGAKTDSLGLPSKVKQVSSLLKSDKLVRDVLKRNKKPALSENILQARKKMKIVPDNKTGLILLSFENTDTAFAKRFMDTLVKIIPIMYFQDQVQLVDKKKLLLDEEIKLVQDNMKEASDGLRYWLAQHDILDFDREKELIINKLAKLVQDKTNIEKTKEVYDEVELGLMEDKTHSGYLLAWAGALTYDTLLSGQLVCYARDTSRNSHVMVPELLIYIKEMRKIFESRQRSIDQEIDRYQNLHRTMNSYETNYRMMNTKVKTSQKVFDALLQRKTELELYRVSVHEGEIEVVRSPGIR